MPVVCLEPVVDVPVGEPFAGEQADREEQRDRQRDELCNVGGEQDEHDQATDKLPPFPAQRRKTLPILPALHDSEENQGQQNDEWQQGGGHVLLIGRTRDRRNP